MNGIFQMQGGKNWILPKQINSNRFFWDSHWLDIWSNHFCPSLGPNGGIMAMDSEQLTGNGRRNIALIGPSMAELWVPIGQFKLIVAQCLNAPLSFWQRNPYQKRLHIFFGLNAEIGFLRFKSKDQPFKCSKKISAMVQEVETNRLIPLNTPLFFGWTISLSSETLSKNE